MKCLTIASLYLSEQHAFNERKESVLVSYGTVTNHHKLDGLKQQKLSSHSSGGQKSKINLSERPCSLQRL